MLTRNRSETPPWSRSTQSDVMNMASSSNGLCEAAQAADAHASTQDTHTSRTRGEAADTRPGRATDTRQHTHTHVADGESESVPLFGVPLHSCGGSLLLSDSGLWRKCASGDHCIVAWTAAKAFCVLCVCVCVCVCRVLCLLVLKQRRRTAAGGGRDQRSTPPRPATHQTLHACGTTRRRTMTTTSRQSGQSRQG